MKNEGFALIEVLLSLCVLTILFTVGMSLSKFEGDLSTDIRSTGYVYEIQNLLSYGKAVCKEKNKYGKIIVNYRLNEIKFREGEDSIEKTIKLPKDLELITNSNVFITPKGKIQKGFTIMITDKWGRRQEITIRVGVDLIDIEGE